MINSKTSFRHAIKGATPGKLRKLGFGLWEKIGRKYLYLIPGTLYNHIPENFPVYNISWKKELFKNGKADDDTRYGFLPYGIVVTTKPRNNRNCFN